MSNIEQQRELKISGYVHPTENIPNNNNINPYKSFNTEKKDYTYIPYNNKGIYATFTDKNRSIKGCPDCGGDAIYICDCELRDKQCSKGHIWYYDKSFNIKRDDPHKDE